MKIFHALCFALSLLVSNAAWAEEIRWKFQPGEQWTIEAEQLTEMQRSGDDSESLSLKLSLVWKTTVEHVNSDGVATLSQELTHAKLSIRSKRGEQSFDSANPSAGGSNNPYWDSTRARLGKPLRIQVRSTGEVVESEVSKVATEAIASTDAPTTSRSNLLTPSATAFSTTGLGIQFPGEQVHIGEPWTTRSKIHLEQHELLIDNTYQYVGMETLDEKSFDKFKSSTGLRFAQPSLESKISKQDSEGTIWFDRQSGKLVRLECAQELMVSDKDHPSQRLLQSIELKMAPVPIR